MRLSDGIQHLVTNILRKNENFEENLVNNNMNAPVNNGNLQAGDSGYGLVFLITYIVILVLLLLIGKHLWNNVLVNLVTVVSPAKSVVDILGLAVLLAILNI